MSDVAVVGAGIVGLSCAYALRLSGASVRVYERGVPGAGQSGGEERLFRHAHDDPRLVALARSALEVWREWESRLGVELVSRDGALAAGPAVERRARILAGKGVPVRVVDARSALPLLGDAALPPALFDPTAGAIRAAAAITALAPADVVHDEVLAVRPLPGGGVAVHAGGRVDHHDRAILCAGVGNLTLARGLGLDLPLGVSMHARATFSVRGTPPAWLPCWQDSTGVFGETGVYGAPSPDGKRYSLGVGEACRPGDAAALDDMVRRASAYASRALPGLDPAPVAVRHCWVTELPWGDDGLAIYDAEDVLVVAGNNLFKHAPALGTELARVAAGAAIPDWLRPEAQLGAPV